MRSAIRHGREVGREVECTEVGASDPVTEWEARIISWLKQNSGFGSILVETERTLGFRVSLLGPRYGERAILTRIDFSSNDLAWLLSADQRAMARSDELLVDFDERPSDTSLSSRDQERSLYAKVGRGINKGKIFCVGRGGMSQAADVIVVVSLEESAAVGLEARLGRRAEHGRTV